jgi:hypothetical protein
MVDTLEEYLHKQKVKSAKWYLKNRDSVITKQKQYYQDNKTRLKEKSLQIVRCPKCHTEVKQGSLSHHKRTPKCDKLSMYICM